MSWYNWIISALNSLSLGTYIFPSFNTKSPSIFYSFSHNSLTFAFFISLTILTTSSSLPLAFFIFSIISTSSSSITTSCKLQTQLSFINTWFSLSLSISTFQSGFLLSPSAFPILIPGMCFKVKSNLDKYNAHQACL